MTDLFNLVPELAVLPADVDSLVHDLLVLGADDRGLDLQGGQHLGRGLSNGQEEVEPTSSMLVPPTRGWVSLRSRYHFQDRSRLNLRKFL